MRIQKFMAKCGVASRRKSEDLILQGRVKINGVITKELGVNVDLKSDIVKVDNNSIFLEINLVHIILNKPTGCVTTVSDQFNRPTVLELIKNIDERIYPVGRLDYDTSGLLLLTNDGDLTYKLTHPKHEISKKYIAKLKGIPTEKALDRFRKGLKIENYITSKAKIEILERNKITSVVSIEIHEGKNRQIRKMCEKINHPVITLKRIAIGQIELSNLGLSKWRYLSNEEVNYLKNI